MPHYPVSALFAGMLLGAAAPELHTVHPSELQRYAKEGALRHVRRFAFLRRGNCPYGIEAC